MTKTKSFKRMPRFKAKEARSLALANNSGFFSGSYGAETAAGTTVTEQNALTITAVWNAVNIFANTIAGLDRYVAERGNQGGHSPAPDHPAYQLVRSRPNRINTGFRFFQTIVSHKKTHGNGYAEIERFRDIPRALHLQDPRNVLPYLESDGSLWYRLQREHKEIPARDMLHFAGLGFDGIRGYSPISIAREALGLAMAQDKFAASTYGNGATPQGLVEMQGDPKAEVVSRFRDNWHRAHQGPDRAGTLAILTGGAKWVQTAFSPADAQLILSRNFSVAEVARLFNLPQHMLGNLDKATFGNIEEQNIQFYQLSLMPELTEMEAELDAKLFTPSEHSRFFVYHDVAGILRGNIAAQTAQNTADFAMGVKSINEIRTSQGLNPIDDAGGNKHWIPVNNLTAIEDMGQSAAAPLDATDQAVDAASPAAPVEDVQATALNGAQIASLLLIVQQVAAGDLPSDSAKGMIAASFPGLTDAQIAAILSSLEGFTPEPDPQRDTFDAAQASALAVDYGTPPTEAAA